MEFQVYIDPPDKDCVEWKAFSQAFPGCKGTGSTREEAIRNSSDLLWINV